MDGATTQGFQDEHFVGFVVRQIVNNPADVKITRTTDELGVLLSVKVNKDDMGLLIGRSGSTAKAIRTLARIVGMRNNDRVNLKIEEPEGSTFQSRPRKTDNRSVDDVMDYLKS